MLNLIPRCAMRGEWSLSFNAGTVFRRTASARSSPPYMAPSASAPITTRVTRPPFSWRRIAYDCEPAFFHGATPSDRASDWDAVGPATRTRRKGLELEDSWPTVKSVCDTPPGAKARRISDAAKEICGDLAS